MSYKTVFKTLAEIQEHEPTLNDFNIKAITPSIGRVIDNYIIDLIGEEIAIPLIEKYMADQELSPLEQSLLKEIQAPTIHLAWYYFLPRHRIQIRQAGVSVAHGDNIKQPTDRKNDKLDTYFIETGLNLIDGLLKFMEKNSTNFQIETVPWLDTKYGTASNSLIIKNAKELSIYISQVKNSSRTFLALKYILTRIQDTELRAALGEEFEPLIQSIVKPQTAELTAKELKLIRLAKPAMAYRAWEYAIDELSLQISPDGVVVLNNQASRDTQSKLPATPDMLRPSRDIFRKLADQSFTQIIEFLNENQSDEAIRIAPSNDNENASIFWL